MLAVVAFVLTIAAPAFAAGDLVGQWHLDDGSGGVTPDSSGNGLTGTLSAGAAIVPGGRFGNALDLPTVGSTGSRVDVASSSVLQPSRVSVLVWVKNSGSPGAYKWMLSKGASACSGASYGLTSGSDGSLYFSTFDGTNSHGSAGAPASIWDGNWHAVAGTYDGAAMRLYVDGAEVGNGVPTTNPIGYGLQFDHLHIGNYAGSGFCAFDYTFPGLIDEVNVYNRALSAAEIASLQGPAAPPGEVPPQVTSVDTAAPLTAGKPAVLAASIAGDVKGLAWDLRGDGSPDIVSQATQTSVSFRPKPGLNTIKVYPVLASGLLGDVQVKSFTAPAVAPPTTSTARKIIRVLGKRPPVDLVGTSAGLLKNIGDITACQPDTTVRSGSVEIKGCVSKIAGVDQVPAAERGIVARIRSQFALANSAEQVNKAFELSDAYRANGPVTMNGLTLTPSGGASIVVYPQANALASSNASLSAGAMRLGSRRDFIINTKQSDRTGVDLRNFPILGGLSQIGGFRLGGDVNVKLVRYVGLGKVTQGGVPGHTEAHLTVKLTLPSFLKRGGFDVQSTVQLYTTMTKGLVLDNLTLGPLNADMGGLAVQDLRVDYTRANNEWRGQGRACVIGTVCLDMTPPNGSVVIQNGNLSFAGASLAFPPPGIVLFPGLNLERIGFGFGLNPTRFTGNARLTALKIYTIDGRMVLAFPSEAQPYFLDRREVGNGFPANLYSQRHTRPTFGVAADAFLKAPVVGDIKLGNGYFLYEYPGYVNFGGSMEQSFFKVITIAGGLSGEFNSANGRYNLGGNVRGCLIGVLCRGAAGVVSNRGIGACLEVGPLHIGGGATYSPFSIKIWPIDGCKWSPFAEKNVRAAQAGATQTVHVANGDPSRVVQLEGVSEAPRVKVTAPDGTTLETPAGAGLVEKGVIRIIRSESANITAIGLQDPKPGDYKIDPLTGSPAIQTIGQADDQPDAKVTAKVRGRGSTRTLVYDIRRRAKQRVTFSEVGRNGGMKPIGIVTGGGKGTLRFSPAPGGGVRTIQAQFELDGIPAETRTVTRFNPAPPALAKPRGLRVRRAGKSLRVTWRAVSGATAYEVVTTPTGGAQKLVRARGHRLTIRGVSKSSSGHVSVRGVAPLRRGPAASTRFRATAKRVSRFEALPRCRGKTRFVCRAA